MSVMLNPEHFNAPKIEFADLPAGMGEKLEVGDTIVAKDGEHETSASVIQLDEANQCAYLSKELPKHAEYSVQETATGDSAPFDAMKKEARLSAEDHGVPKDALTGPLPDLKKLLIQISIEQGDSND